MFCVKRKSVTPSISITDVDVWYRKRTHERTRRCTGIYTLQGTVVIKSITVTLPSVYQMDGCRLKWEGKLSFNSVRQTVTCKTVVKKFIQCGQVCPELLCPRARDLSFLNNTSLFLSTTSIGATCVNISNVSSYTISINSNLRLKNGCNFQDILKYVINRQNSLTIV